MLRRASVLHRLRSPEFNVERPTNLLTWFVAFARLYRRASDLQGLRSPDLGIVERPTNPPRLYNKDKPAMTHSEVTSGVCFGYGHGGLSLL